MLVELDNVLVLVQSVHDSMVDVQVLGNRQVGDNLEQNMVVVHNDLLELCYVMQHYHRLGNQGILMDQLQLDIWRLLELLRMQLMQELRSKIQIFFIEMENLQMVIIEKFESSFKKKII